MELNRAIDHTLLKQDCTQTDIKKLCTEAREHNFFSVCVPPSWVQTASKNLTGSTTSVCTVIGFPWGYEQLSSKLSEIKHAIEEGAQEVDVVLNVSFVKSELWEKVNEELSAFGNNKGSALVKVIIESGILSPDEIMKICEFTNNTAIDFLKTSTGFAKAGATLEAVQLMRKNLKDSIKIKASGGIKTREQARSFIEAGASRLGCSSSVEICNL